MDPSAACMTIMLDVKSVTTKPAAILVPSGLQLKLLTQVVEDSMICLLHVYVPVDIQMSITIGVFDDEMRPVSDDVPPKAK